MRNYPCPACGHGDLPPGLSYDHTNDPYDHTNDRYLDCTTCEGEGYLSHAALAALARETELVELAGYIEERDPALSPAEVLREMGFEPIEAEASAIFGGAL